MAEKIIKAGVVDGYVSEMARYAIGDNIRRMLPDVRDSFKPVQRRILYGMEELNAVSEATRKKSARIVGDVMGKYHPHGDQSIYGAMDTLTGWWKCKMPLIIGWGNWGNFQGDKPAAMRYTEAYLSPFANDCVLGLIKKYRSVVDWNPNFDGSTKEPDMLPTMVPLLLINGASGIGVGVKMDVPKHNFHEVIQEARAMLKDPNHQVVLIPDHCLECDIIDANWKKICNEGNGKYRVRGRIEIGEYKGKPALFIKSLPDGVNSDSIKAKLEEMVVKGVLVNQINDIVWEGSDKEMNLVVQLKKDKDPYYIREIVYKNTGAESSYTINFEAVYGVSHTRFSYTSYMQMYIESAKFILFRLYCSKYHDAMTRAHELEAYIKVMNSGKIDDIYKAIRKNSKSDNSELINWLCGLLDITEFQAAFIIKAPLSKFSKGNMVAYQAEYNECIATAAENRDIILNDGHNGTKDMIAEKLDELLQEYDKKYGTKRICKVLKEADYSGVPKGIFKIVVTENNFIRKLMENENVGVIKGDNPNYIIKADNTENILLFSNKGKVFKLPVANIPLSDKGPGTDIRMLCKGLTSDIANVLYEPDVLAASKLEWKHYLVVVSAGNSIKRLELEDFLSVPPSGILFTKLNDADFIQDVSIVPDGLDMVIYSGHKALRFPVRDIPIYKRNAVGVASMNTNEFIGGISTLYNDITHIAVVTKSGKINKFDVVGMPIGKRNQAGSSVIKLGSTDSIISIHGVNDNSVIRIISANGTTDVVMKDIPSSSSVAAGTKVISTRGDYIIKTKLYQQ